mmetsp:Transcript_7001/g.10318  ORF Transcript_7001/g.10318 Transcript_7001/m.10318 type:complete len:279 (+) Transcript_7001:2280-3116(+)
MFENSIAAACSRASIKGGNFTLTTVCPSLFSFWHTSFIILWKGAGAGQKSSLSMYPIFHLRGWHSFQTTGGILGSKVCILCLHKTPMIVDRSSGHLAIGPQLDSRPGNPNFAPGAFPEILEEVGLKAQTPQHIEAYLSPSINSLPIAATTQPSLTIAASGPEDPSIVLWLFWGLTGRSMRGCSPHKDIAPLHKTIAPFSLSIETKSESWGSITIVWPMSRLIIPLQAIDSCTEKGIPWRGDLTLPELISCCRISACSKQPAKSTSDIRCLSQASFLRR